MLKWARRIFVVLLLGAMVNVAVAWGCALRNHLWGLEVRYERVTSGDWELICVQRAFGSEEVHVCDRLSDAVDLTTLRTYPTTPWWLDWHRRFGAVGTLPWGQAHGWPMYTLTAWQDWNPDPVQRSDTDEDSATYGGWGFGDGRSFRLIPATPIWSGSAFNTAFYGVCLFLLAYSARATRGIMRRRRGDCAHCGYPRGTSPVCTECGEALPC